MNLDKIMKKLSPTAVEEMNALAPADLEKTVVASEESINTAANELAENPQYQAAKQACKDLSAGLREVRSYQRAKIAYALHLLREGGKV